MPERMSEDLPDRILGGRRRKTEGLKISLKLSSPPLPCQKVLPEKCQNICHIKCHIECQNICQIECVDGDHSK